MPKKKKRYSLSKKDRLLIPGYGVGFFRGSYQNGFIIIQFEDSGVVQKFPESVLKECRNLSEEQRQKSISEKRQNHEPINANATLPKKKKPKKIAETNPYLQKSKYNGRRVFHEKYGKGIVVGGTETDISIDFGDCTKVFSVLYFDENDDGKLVFVNREKQTPKQEKTISESKKTHLSENVVVYVYTGKLACSIHPRRTELVIAATKSAHDNLEHSIVVYYCAGCKKYFVNAEQYTDFARKYGLPVFKINTRRLLSGNEGELAERSKLNLAGYNVNSTIGLTATQRRNILVGCMITGFMTQAEIASHLEWCIRFNSHAARNDNAIQKWRDDLSFILYYDMDKMRTVKAEFRPNK